MSNKSLSSQQRHKEASIPIERVSSAPGGHEDEWGLSMTERALTAALFHGGPIHFVL